MWMIYLHCCLLHFEVLLLITLSSFSCSCCLLILLSLQLQGPGGVTVKKTNQALIIGIYDEPMAPGQCNMIVERLGDYLIDQGL